MIKHHDRIMSNTAVEVVNGRYRCFNRLSDSPGSPQNDQKPGWLSSASSVWPACSQSHPKDFS